MALLKFHPFFDYIHLQKDYVASQIVKDCMKLVRDYKQQLSFFQNSAPIFYLYNFVTDRYIIISHSLDIVLGYSSTYVMDGGIYELSSYLKKEDLEIYDKKVFPDNLRILSSIPHGKQNEYIFTTNYRIRNRKGGIHYFMEKYMYIQCTPDGFPLISLGFAYDISDIKGDSKIIHTVRQIDPKTGILRPDCVLKNYHFVREKEGLLSKREIEVLKWICEGVTSKQIADKLFISINTIHNHKKKMREKTNCATTSELLMYAARNNLL